MAQDKAPQFPPSIESPNKTLGDALAALDTLAALSTKPAPPPPPPPRKVKRLPVESKEIREPKRSSAFFTSLLLHFAVVFFIVRVPLSFFLHHHQSTSFRLPQIVYEFHEIDFPQDLPALKPPGPGGKPGKGTQPDQAPARGSLAFHPKVTVVSNPPNPDNNFQTIIQPSVPHDVKIKVNLKLPNIIMGGVLPSATPPPPTPPPPMKLQLPNTLHSLTVPQVAVASATPPDLIIPASSNPNMPPIPMPEPPPPPLVPKLSQSNPISPVLPNNVGLAAESNGSSSRLLVLSLNPAPPSSSISIPAGNRYGAFTISPGGYQPGSPSGVNGGSLNGGEGGPGSGGDNSTGVGSGNRGGGGNGAGKSNLAVSTTGKATSGGSGMGTLEVIAAAAKLVYPILRPPPKNRFAMVVTAGPVGGGGLHVYGVLTGGKVYTIFLPMPNRNWILQYCVLDGATDKNSNVNPQVKVALNFGLLPPDVDKRFDFHRPALSPEEKQGMIVLHGIISKDGTIEKLNVYQGVQKVADQAALDAFDRWKFSPALENGKPISVEILVGIPLS